MNKNMEFKELCSNLLKGCSFSIVFKVLFK